MRAVQNTTAPQLPFNGIVKEGRVLVSPELAARILNETNYAGQRKIDPSQVATYAEMMRRGDWLAGGQIAFGRLAGALHLVNGQHRLSGVAMSGLAQEFQVLIVDCKTVEALRELYWRFDAVMRQRSTVQILGAAGVAEENKLSKTMTISVYRAVSFITNDMNAPTAGRHKDPVGNRIIDVRLETCSHWWNEARLYEALIKEAPHGLRSKLHTGSIVAIALVTLKHQPARAKEFWHGIASNDGLKKGDPRNTLFTWLLTTHDKGSGEMYLGACAAAWNAFLSKRSLSLLRPTSPIRINGTPFDGKTHRSAA